MKIVTLISVGMTAIAALTIAQTASAEARPDVQVMQRTVKFGDLNLDSEQGATALLHRIRIASRYVCGGYTSNAAYANTRNFRACVRDAQSRAIAQVNSPAVQAVASESSGVRMAAQ